MDAFHCNTRIRLPSQLMENTILDSVVIRIALTIAIVTGLLSLGRSPAVSAAESDVSCLKSLKDSLQDPSGSLSNWDFSARYAGFICSFTGISCWSDSGNMVLSIELIDMGLKGHFPASLRNCSTLTSLDISYNQISGPIPSNIDLILPFITSLDLSNNNFSGLIPPSIVKCSYLNYLRLDTNKLWGPIPNEIGLLPRLRYFSVSNNMLTGPVPRFGMYTDADIGNNPGLCGHALEACESHSDHNTLQTFFRGLMIGWAVSMSLVFLVCLCAIPEIDVKKLTRRENKKRRPQMNQEILLRTSNEMNNTSRITEMEKYATRIPFEELTDATDNFSQDNVIGIGETGTTYKATIQNGWFVAVKWLFDSEQLDRRIASEILTVGRLRHNRLLPLIGFCLEKNDTFLVYKYMSNGNLYDWLHLRKGDGEIIRYWPLRLKIAVGVAEGLAWLHQNCSLTVIHEAISSKCILLDKNFEPKISNFWEAKLIKSTNSLSNSRFFPRDDSEESQSDKKDVYFFGIMLLELITGKEPQELASSIRDHSPDSLLAHFSLAFEFDETLSIQGFDDQILQCFEVAKNCLRSNPGQRPSMVQVHATLVAFARIFNYTSDLENSF